MNKPRSTLRQLSGLPDTPAALAESTLILIDCQNTYRRGVMRLENVEPALEQASRLLARARSAGVPVMHIRHDAGAGSPYDLDTPEGAIADEVAPADGETVITKAYPNAFVATDLHDHLQRVGNRHLILAGFMTHMCVNSTARGAFNLGYAPTVIASATATRTLERAGRTIDAEQLQNASLVAIADMFGVVVDGIDAIRD